MEETNQGKDFTTAFLVVRLIDAFRWLGTIAILAWASVRIAEALAGEDTKINVGLTVSIGISVTLCATTAVLVQRLLNQRRQLERLRSRTASLEATLRSNGLSVP